MEWNPAPFIDKLAGREINDESEKIKKRRKIRKPQNLLNRFITNPTSDSMPKLANFTGLHILCNWIENFAITIMLSVYQTFTQILT